MHKKMKTKDVWNKKRLKKTVRVKDEPVNVAIVKPMNQKMNSNLVENVGIRGRSGLVDSPPFKENRPGRENTKFNLETTHQYSEVIKRNKTNVQERLIYCPECKSKNILSLVKRLQYEEDRYWVCCTREEGCIFLEEFRGKAVATKEDLILYGLPGQLLQHMDIFYEDINKIVRFCMSEYIKFKYLAQPVEGDLEKIKDTVRMLIEFHNLDSLEAIDCQANCAAGNFSETVKCEVKVEETKAEPSSSEFVSTNSQSAKPYISCLNAEEEMLMTLTGFSVTNPSQPTQTQPVGMITDDDVLQLLQSLDSKPCDEATLSKDQENKILCSSSKVKKFFESPSPESCNPYDAMRKLAESLVADLPSRYQEDVKTAFYKVEGYKFPQDFVNHTSPDKVPLIKIVKERQRQEKIKAEMDAQINEFMNEMGGINSLLF